MVVSSVYKYKYQHIQMQAINIFIRNNKGPRLEPCDAHVIITVVTCCALLYSTY